MLHNTLIHFKCIIIVQTFTSTMVRKQNFLTCLPTEFFGDDKHCRILLVIAKDDKINTTATLKEFFSATALSGKNAEKIQFSI